MAAILVLVGLVAGPAAAGGLLGIELIPYGPVPGEVLNSLQAGLARELGARVWQGAALPVPEQAYTAPRRQYQAEAFLPALQARRSTGTDLVLGVTMVDLYVPRLNFVFGVADPGSRTAIISLARLDPEFYGQPANPALREERALKEAVHELGHLLGLGHCPDPACIMFFSNTLMDTDRKGPGFCPRCRAKLPDSTSKVQ